MRLSCEGSSDREMQQAEGREARRAHQRVVADCGLPTAGRRLLGPLCALRAERGSPGSCAGSAAASTGKGSDVARRMYSHLGTQGAAGGGGDETSSALGPENGPSTGQISLRSRIGRESDGNFAEGTRELRAGATGGDTSPNASSTSQREPNQNLGSTDRNYRGQPTDHLIHTIYASRTILQTSSVILSQEGGAALDAELVIFSEFFAPRTPQLVALALSSSFPFRAYFESAYLEERASSFRNNSSCNRVCSRRDSTNSFCTSCSALFLYLRSFL